MRHFIMVISIIVLPFFGYSQNWMTSFDEATDQATRENKRIVMVFQGSDWCAPCIKLSREVWETEVFKNYSRDHYIMVQVDFPRQKKNALPDEQQARNNALAERYNKNGIFPLVVVLDNNGEVLGETGYDKTSPEEYIKRINSFK